MPHPTPIASRSSSAPMRRKASRPSVTSLLADSSATYGALSSHRLVLGRGADGAVPHTHRDSSELFYILDGALDVLIGEQVATARVGDLVVVPSGLPHAFGAHRDSTAEALVVITPGIERFDYFRFLVRIRAGLEPRETLLGLQDRFDTHFVTSDIWRDRRDRSAPVRDRSRTAT